MPRNFPDWLSSFVEYGSIGEAPTHILWWVGVSTIAGALRRHVWIDQETFQWTPNFYIVVVAEPGIIAKSTTANVGFNLLRQVDGIKFGPDIVTWERLVAKLGEEGEFFEVEGQQEPMHAMTCAVDEFGTFIDPDNREQIDTLTSLWDSKKGKFSKETKTQGEDHLVNPWLNIFACTTPTWVNQNFPEYFLGSGFMSRLITLEAENKRIRVAYPKRRIKDLRARKLIELKLVADLKDMAACIGEFRMTPEAEDWGEAWYEKHWDKYAVGSRELQGYPARKQTHLHKLAMVVAMSRGSFPIIDVRHMEEAEAALAAAEPGINKVFSVIGSQGVTKAAGEIVAALTTLGGRALRRDIYGKYFFRRLSNKDFDEAIRGAVAAGMVEVSTTVPVELKLTKREPNA